MGAQFGKRPGKDELTEGAVRIAINTMGIQASEYFSITAATSRPRALTTK